MQGYDIISLDATGYDAPVPNEYGSNGSDTLMVMLPGLGYSNEMPLMFYVRQLAFRRGWDILNINYDYRGMIGTTDEERVDRLATDCRVALDAALAKGDYARVVLVGKSLGTIAMMTLLQSDIELRTTLLWLTPIIGWPAVREAMSSAAADSAVVIGTRDQHYDLSVLQGLRERGSIVKIVKGGDHSLGVESGVVESISVLGEIVGSLDEFLRAKTA